MTDLAAEGDPMTPEQQVEYWMDRYFTLQDEHVVLINQLRAIAAIVNGEVPGD